MSFYRLYRPQIIDEIDNAAVQKQLLSLLTKNKKDLPHAYLFYGPKGAGKTTAARIIAKLFNCTSPTKSGPCGTCEACTAIARGNTMDVLEVDAASNRGIDEIRALRDTISLSPSSFAFKIYIIDEVHMLTNEAFNALLKTLEEPPEHAVFVLATTDPQKVPVTIKSRCMLLSFNKASPVELNHALSKIAKKEKIDIDKEAFEVIASYADGSFRDAVKYLEQLSFEPKGQTITAELVKNMLAISDDRERTAFYIAIKTRNLKEAFACVQRLVDRGADVMSFVAEVLGDLQSELVSQAKSGDSGTLQQKELIHLFLGVYADMKNAAIVELPLELAIAEYCAGPSSQPVTTTKEEDTPKYIHAKTPSPAAKSEPNTSVSPESPNVQKTPTGMLTVEKLTDCWRDFIEAVKPYNNSIAGVLRSARPKSVSHGIVTIEAFYTFHREKLSEPKTKEVLIDTLKKLFGDKVKVEVVLGKK
jgi:DNA polymerase III subunit gamma/tau